MYYVIMMAFHSLNAVYLFVCGKSNFTVCLILWTHTKNQNTFLSCQGFWWVMPHTFLHALSCYLKWYARDSTEIRFGKVHIFHHKGQIITMLFSEEGSCHQSIQSLQADRCILRTIIMYTMILSLSWKIQQVGLSLGQGKRRNAGKRGRGNGEENTMCLLKSQGAILHHLARGQAMQEE